MGNLGWYQLLTTLAKKVGGPKQLIAIFIGGGALFGSITVAGGIAIKKKITYELIKKKQIADASIIYTVKCESSSKEGLRFKVGDKFKVLELDGNAGLVEIIGDNNSPYFVSLKFLCSISDYRLNEGVI